MVTFELGNPTTIEELLSEEWALGKFVFRRHDSSFKLFLGKAKSHPELVKNLGLVARGETEYSSILGGGEFHATQRELTFSGMSGTYGQVPNSFLIDCIRNARIPNVDKFFFNLEPYSPTDELLGERRKFWRDLGGYKLDTERKSYIFDGNMNPIST